MKRRGAGAAAADVIQDVARDGAVIVDGFVEAGLLARLQAELLPHVDARGIGSWTHPKDATTGGSFAGKLTKRVGGLVAKSPAFRELIVDPRLLDLADHFLLPTCATYRLHGTQLMAVGPGEGDQVLHRDETDWPHFPSPKPHLTVSAMIALTDFTLANGATRVVPGSQLLSDLRDFHAGEVVPAVMPAGSALVYDGKVLHGAGANRTKGEWRVGLWFAYALGWLRQYENQVLMCPPAIAAAMPTPVARLLGYALHDPRPVEGGVLGGVDTGRPGERDPLLLLGHSPP
jgi:phytanoyl-CoA dioxygenase PhyH